MSIGMTVDEYLDGVVEATGLTREQAERSFELVLSEPLPGSCIEVDESQP